ncbi:hypothetical protein EW146_g3013 [Bondarzewia mesenterica]|uniref:Uncharacterized protein n=1 Tax=Bondarzewia mesenterica TaxID=1095465 RepID=A0A4S4M4R1_9AGAM|nr:hypothetical protein EW146_g3013 [Bondarzewia mesenterica]
MALRRKTKAICAESSRNSTLRSALSNSKEFRRQASRHFQTLSNFMIVLLHRQTSAFHTTTDMAGKRKDHMIGVLLHAEVDPTPPTQCTKSRLSTVSQPLRCFREARTARLPVMRLVSGVKDNAARALALFAIPCSVDRCMAGFLAYVIAQTIDQHQEKDRLAIV